MFQRIIAIDASPNLQKSDVFLACKMLSTPWKWQQHISCDLLKEYFDQFKSSYTLLCQSGRAALYLILTSILKPGDEVITQAFTCLAVPNAISWAGGKAVFVDIQKNDYNIDPTDLLKKISAKTKAVIVQHTFGIPADLNQIKKICQEKKIFLIEDCAHALGAGYNNQPLGSFGDAAIFSFNQDKVVSGVCGGVAIVCNRQIGKNLNKDPHLANISSKSIIKILLHSLIWYLALPIYESFNLGKGIIWLARQFGIFCNTITDLEGNGQMPSGLLKTISEPQAELIMSGLKRLEKDNNRRREIADRYRSELNSLPLNHPIIQKVSLPIYLRYPIQVEDPEKLFRLARNMGIILGKWYNVPVFPWVSAAKKYYRMGSCPVAENVGRKIVNLPTYPTLSDQDVDKIINVVKKVYANN